MRPADKFLRLGTIVSGELFLTAVLLISFLCRIGTYSLFPTENSYTFTGISFGLTPAGSCIAGFICSVAAGLILIGIDRVHTIIRARSMAPAALFLLLITCTPQLYPLSRGLAATPFLLLATYCLMSSFQKESSQINLFHTFLLLGTGSLVYPKLTWLAPLFLVGAVIFMSLNIRSFFAAILGWALPFWILFAIAILSQDLSMLYAPFRELIHFQALGTNYPAWQLLLLALLLIAWIASILNKISTKYDDKMRTRTFLNFLSLLSIALLLGTVLQPSDGVNMLPLACAPVSLLMGHHFTLANNKGDSAFILFVLLALVTVYFVNVWMIL